MEKYLSNSIFFRKQDTYVCVTNDYKYKENMHIHEEKLEKKLSKKERKWSFREGGFKVISQYVFILLLYVFYFHILE